MKFFRSLALTRNLVTVLLILGMGMSRGGESVSSASEPVSVMPGSALRDWWNGKGITGNWFGVRDTLADRGLTFGGRYYGAYFAALKGGGANSRGFYFQGLEFNATQNFGKLFDVDALKGVTAFGEVRWRDPRGNADPNDYVQANKMFNPAAWESGTGWRLVQFGLSISSAELLPVKDMVVVTGGWVRPWKEFVEQPLSCLFVNAAINSAKGLGGNIPFSSSFSTWGGTLKVKPTEHWYTKAGLFMAYPQAAASANHGLAFEGYAQDPSRNGLMAMAETGMTPEFGSAALPGKYAFGGYWFGVDGKSCYGQTYEGQWGLYWQADQMLFREPGFEAEPSADGKSFKSPVSMEKSSLSDQGLSTFNLVSFAPAYNNQFPFYFQSGLVYKGLIPGRDNDQTMIAIGYGAYSFDQIEVDQMAGVADQSNYTGVIEGGYRVAINGFSFVQPFAQYIFRPDGTGATPNAAVLGFYFGANF